MDPLNPLSLPFWYGTGSALLCGGLIGLERQLRGKPAGIRTSALICLSTQIFVELAARLDGANADPTRVLGQVVVGVGFLGAGVILARQGEIRGVTSAAVIWVLAGIGATIGLRQYADAFALTFVTLLVLVGVEQLENTFRHLRRGIQADENPQAQSSGGP